MRPQGFNIGSNIGRVGGAGIDQHVHMHIVPRWSGDANFMPVIADTKVISESMDETLRKLRAGFAGLESRFSDPV
jgi:ATP adenylyltransferase